MLKTAMIFGDHMVLQRQKPIKVWGTEENGTVVTGILKGKDEEKAQVVVDASGEWMLEFVPCEAERGVILEISDGDMVITYRDIDIGEVWLAGGQSNMEYFLYYDAQKAEVLEGPMNNAIRFFDYPEISYEGQSEVKDFSYYGFWRTCTPEDLIYFSAVGYYFANSIQPGLDVPVGIVGCNWGGTPACAWMAPEYLQANEGRIWLDEYVENLKTMDVEAYIQQFNANPMNMREDPFSDEFNNKILYPGLTPEEMDQIMKFFESQGPDPGVGPVHPWRPCGVYETMLKKIAPYAVRGVIYYQGESDEKHSELYSVVLSNLIRCWRDLWQDEFPFLFVQLAPYGGWMGSTGEQYPILRSQQELVSKTVPGTWMASSSDAGMEYDIHPKHKKPIGNRLALLARGHVYGEVLACDPPEFTGAERTENGICISFSGARTLHIQGNDIQAMVLTDRDGQKLTWNGVSAEDNKIMIKGIFPKQVTIAFGQTGYYEVNLYNEMDNPVKPFQTTV